VSAYATVQQFRAWTRHLDDVLDLPEDGSHQAIQRLLDRASADLDQYLRWPPPDDPEAVLPGAGRIRAELTSWESWCLAKACVEQATYRLLRDESELAEGASSITAAGGVSFSTAAPDLLGPQAAVSIAGVGVLWRYKHGLGVPDVGDAA